MGRLELWEGRSRSVWEHLWGVPDVEIHDVLVSTNDRVRELAGEGAAAFTTVIAETQTAGRGRGGKRWESPPGMGLWMSFLLRPEGEGAPSLAPILGGLATARAIEAVCPGLRPRIKWPNDVMVSGLKVGGILCEAVGLDAIVVGVGLNIAQRPEDFPPDLRGRATSLAAVGCSGVSRAELAEGVLRQSRDLAEPLPSGLGEGLRGELQRRDALAGRTVHTDTGLKGRAVGVAQDGALLIETGGTRHAVRGGGVSIV